MNKGFWMPKGAGHLSDGDTTFDNPSRIEPKRSHQWFADVAEPGLFPNKKQAVHSTSSKSTSGISNAHGSPWENTSSFHSVPNQFIDRLFGPETARPVNFTERNISPVGTDGSRSRDIDEQFGNDSSVDLSISNAIEDPETCLSYGGIRKVKVNQVRESDSSENASKGHSYDREIDSNIPTVQDYDRGSDTSFMSIGAAYYKEDENDKLMGHTYNTGDHDIPMGHPYNKGDANTISFGSYHDEPDNIPFARPISSYGLYQSSVQISDTESERELDASNANGTLSSAQLAKLRPESASKNKSEFKMSKKEAPNSFPSNVRTLISTGMLDGVPVKYVSLSREELHGIIKGSGYLCGCQSCNFNKVLNAYEFERHAGCKTKHPNNHIYFENGKTIYQIVQELRSTPESLLFNAIQTVTGSPINQKSFRIWKESFQAATRELKRIYGKEELNL